jgi:GTPase Era involved in 16S rRNA processing
MYFQLTPPSISSIRAKFIIEKLSTFPHNISSINIFATGRTHSGKTTLGNRLLGIDYFLSTGRQDCTKEINLIEFPIGLKYFDLPGVCSDDRLENYNRVALNVPQFEEFPVVDEVTLARFQENQDPSEQNLSISHYASLGFNPDLVYYLIAPDKQFARGDRKYLRDLLKRHQNIIYVFNMFANKQTGSSYYATEANIEDVATQLLKVHQSILGDGSKPAIVGVNCWTGEGISELLHQSKQILPGEKGLLFEQLIEYQQQKTPDEYVNQVKRELIRLYAHAACERATGSDTCDQPLHKLCYSLFDFLVSLPVQSEQAENSIDREVNTIVDRVLSNPTEKNQSESLEDRLNYVLGVSHYIFDEGIDSINELIKTYISEPQKQGYEQKNQEFEEWKAESKSYAKQLGEKWEDISSGIEEFSKINNSLESLETEIQNTGEKLQPRIEAHESRYFELVSRRQSLNSRFERFKDRRDRYNANVDKINRSSARLTYEAEQSINKERDYLRREISSIESEDSRIDDLVSDWQRENESIEAEKSKFKDRIDQYNKKVERRDRKRRLIQQKLKEHNELEKSAQDEINFWFEMLKAFEEELNSLDKKISQRIDEMNVHVEEIRSRLSEDYLERFSSIEVAINELQEVINRCIDEMNIFHNQIFTFNQEINCCLFRLNINKMVTQVLQKTTEHYFDETGEFEYRGSNYHYFRQHGVAIGLALTTMTLVGLDQEYEEFYNNLLRKVECLGDFPDRPAESQILSLLEFNINSLFDSSLEQVIRQAVL